MEHIDGNAEEIGGHGNVVFEKDMEGSLDGQKKQCGGIESGRHLKNAALYNQKEAAEIPGPCIERKELGKGLLTWNDRRN